MCKIIVQKWKNLKSTHAAEMLKSFPDCGVKYTGKFGQGLVLVRPDLTDIEFVKSKAKMAAIKSNISHVFIIPRPVVKAMGL